MRRVHGLFGRYCRYRVSAALRGRTVEKIRDALTYALALIEGLVKFGNEVPPDDIKRTKQLIHDALDDVDRIEQERN